MFMGGEYLPNLAEGEVDIARISLQSVTADQISIRARRKLGRVSYAIVDEYGDEGFMTHAVNPATSILPLSMREYLAALDQAEVEKNTPMSISLTDPAAQWTGTWGPAFYAYSAHYLIDIAAGVVVDVEATPAHRADEINAAKTMIEWVEERFDLKPDSLIGDANYGTAETLGWMVDEKQIEPQPTCAPVHLAAATSNHSGPAVSRADRDFRRRRCRWYSV